VDASTRALGKDAVAIIATLGNQVRNVRKLVATWDTASLRPCP